MFVSIDVIFVEEDYAYYLRGYLDASLKGGEKSWDVLPLPSTSISSSETIAPTSRAFLQPYKLVYSKREKTRPLLDQPNAQSNAPTAGNLQVFPSPQLSINTSIEESTLLTLENQTCYPSREQKPSSCHGFAHCIVKYPISHYMSSHRFSPSYKIYANQLSFVFVSNKLHEALDNPKSKVIMIEETDALQIHWNQLSYQKERKQLVTSVKNALMAWSMNIISILGSLMCKQAFW